MTKPHATIRRTVFFSGRVQGVGFRFSAESIAQRFAVTGYVRNLPDGRVELVAEGSPDQVESFVDQVRDAMRVNIRTYDTTDGPVTDEFDEFRIAY